MAGAGSDVAELDVAVGAGGDRAAGGDVERREVAARVDRQVAVGGQLAGQEVGDCGEGDRPAPR